VHHGQSQQPEYFHFLKYAPAKVGLFATRNSRRIVSGRRLMKRLLYAGLATRLLVATLSPASGAPALNEDVRRGIADPSVRSWKSGGETSTLPWSAPRGHHQPRLGDIPVAPASSQQDLGDEDARIDRIIPECLPELLKAKDGIRQPGGTGPRIQFCRVALRRCG